MLPVSIHYSRKQVRYRIGLLIVCAALLTWVLRSRAPLDNDIPAWVLFATGVVFLGIFLRRYLLRLRTETPVLVFGSDGLEVNGGKPLHFPWRGLSWNLEERDGVHFLSLKAGRVRKDLSLQLLETEPGALRELLRRYAPDGEAV